MISPTFVYTIYAKKMSYSLKYRPDQKLCNNVYRAY